MLEKPKGINTYYNTGVDFAFAHSILFYIILVNCIVC